MHKILRRYTNKSMKFIKTFILLKFFFLLFFFYEPAAFSQVSLPEQSVWKIKIPGLLISDREGKVTTGVYDRTQGTGFFIGKNRFVTNFHVISGIFPEVENIELDFLLAKVAKDRMKKIVLSQEGSSSTLNVKRVVALSALYDLAILETEQNAPSYLKLSFKMPKSREKLVLTGYPKGVFKKMKTAGYIQSHESIYFYTKALPNSKELSGASGSPLLNRQRQVVGVFYRGNNFIKTRHLRELIRGKVGTKCRSVERCIEEERKKIWELAEEGNNPEAQYQLYLDYRSEETAQPELALKWLEKAAENEHPKAQYQLYQHYSSEETAQPELALKWLERAAKQDYAPAQYELYQHYSGKQSFKIVEKNPELALQWLERAAKQEDSLAQYELYLYYNDEKNGNKKNPKRALKWLEKAAENEYPEAQYQLYQHYSSGETAQPELALKWLKRTAEQKHRRAQQVLYLYYNSEKEGKQKNPKLAFKWFEKLKDDFLSSKVSWFFIMAISFYKKGKFEQALDFFKDAVRLYGDHAQYKIGMMYYKGQGTERDLKQALDHFQAAAENGHPLAQYRLARMYHKGQGVEKNPKESLKWSEKAAQQGHPLAQSFLTKSRCHASVTEH